MVVGVGDVGMNSSKITCADGQSVLELDLAPCKSDAVMKRLAIQKYAKVFRKKFIQWYRCEGIWTQSYKVRRTFSMTAPFIDIKTATKFIVRIKYEH